jgi:cysteine desulfurase/selenocysteine lyase
MIASVTWEVTTFAEPPHRFEAGTPPIAQAIGLGAAVDYLSRVGLTATMEHERRMLAYALDRLRGIRGLSFVGAPPERIGVISFTVDGVHPHDVATIVNANGVAVRAGHHCAQPLMRRYGVPATVRASFALYNNQDDVDALVEGLDRVVQVFRP